MENIINVMAGLMAIITFGLIVWALIIGLAKIGATFRTAFRGTNALSKEEAAEIREHIDAYRQMRKSEDAKELQVAKK